MAKVALVRCENYDELLINKVKEAFDLLGGLAGFIKPSDKVFIKLNCVSAFEPEKAITTHPLFTKAVIDIVKEITPNIIIGDNPAIRDLNSVLKKSGNYQVINDANIKIINGKTTSKIYNKEAKIYTEFDVSKEMIDVDVIINIPKLKTHSLTYITCAEKNYFGFIYGLNKSGWHVKASNPLQFGEAINDLYGAILDTFKDKVIINICDGILGLEGEGPSTGGSPRKANCILASTDAIALDRIATEVMGLDSKKIFMNRIASERGYGVGNINNIEILGNSLNDFKEIKFLAPKDSLGNFGLKVLRIKLIRNLLLEYPIVNHDVCIKCGACAKICPPKTMHIEPTQFPKLKTANCIRCWCCAEVCPKNAIIKSKRPLVGRIVF